MRNLCSTAILAIAAMLASAAPAAAAAAAKWTCVGPAYVCGSASPDAPSSAKTSYKKSKKSYYDSDGGGSSYSGMASYYWEPQALASGGRFNPNALTAAHKTLPFGTKVRVTNKNNGESVVVTINDRGPYVGGRIIDLSKAAAHAIRMQNAGVAPVTVTVLGKG